MATPYKFDDSRKARFLGSLRQGERRGVAARRAGVSRATIWLYVKNHPEFAAEIDQAEIDACELVEDALFKKALEGNTTAIIFYLTNRSAERWKDRRTPVIFATNGKPQSAAETEAALLEKLKRLNATDGSTVEEVDSDR